jgi:hypothetical protein
VGEGLKFMGTKKINMAASVRKIRTILANDWDPIGVGGESVDEYDSYIMPIYAILREARSEEALMKYMRWMLEHMGLQASNEALRPIASKLLSLDVQGDESLQ